MAESTQNPQIIKKTPILNGCRDKGGKFIKGNQASVNHRVPQAKKLVTTRAIIDDVINDDNLRAVLRKALILALQGDVKAMREVLDRKLGKPTQPIEHSGEIGGYLNLSPVEKLRILIEQEKANDNASIS